MSVPAVTTDPMADFQNKLRERIRNDIRELLPEDAIQSLVKRAIDEEFFKDRIVDDRSYYGGTRKAPSLFVEEVVKAAKPLITEAIDRFIKEHPDCIEKVMRDYVNENALAIATTVQMTSMLSTMVGRLAEALQRFQR